MGTVLQQVGTVLSHILAKKNKKKNPEAIPKSALKAVRGKKNDNLIFRCASVCTLTFLQTLPLHGETQANGHLEAITAV